MNLVLCSLGNEKTHDFPHRPVEEVSPEHVERLEGLRVVVVEDGHEFLHTFFRHIVTFCHLTSVIYHAQLVCFYVIEDLLASSASLTPFSIMYNKYLRFCSASASPFT